MDLKELELKRLKDKGYDTTHLGCVAYDGLTIIASALEDGIDLGDIPKPGIDNFKYVQPLRELKRGMIKNITMYQNLMVYKWHALMMH